MQMSLGKFFGTSDVEYVERALVHFARELGDFRDVDVLHAETPGDARGGLARFAQAGRRGRGRDQVLVLRDLEAGEVPAHRAVLERHDFMRNAGVDQRLRADDAARAAGAVHDDQGVRRADQIVRAIREFGAGAVDAAGDADLFVFRQGPAVENHDFLAALDLGLDVGRFHARRLVMMLDIFAERLARHVDAAVDLVTGCGPGGNPARENRDVSIAVAAEHIVCALGQSIVVVDEHHARGAARHQ